MHDSPVCLSVCLYATFCRCHSCFVLPALLFLSLSLSLSLLLLQALLRTLSYFVPLSLVLAPSLSTSSLSRINSFSSRRVAFFLFPEKTVTCLETKPCGSSFDCHLSQRAKLEKHESCPCTCTARLQRLARPPRNSLPRLPMPRRHAPPLQIGRASWRERV